LPDAYHGRGQIYRQKGEKAKAIADFKKALQLTEDSKMRQELEQWLKELEAQ
jgi:predicted negative regulator of RcsB-dependent stress response